MEFVLGLLTGYDIGLMLIIIRDIVREKRSKKELRHRMMQIRKELLWETNCR